MKIIYTAFKGVVTEAALINKTPKGYRVNGRGFQDSRRLLDYVVFTNKQHVGWAAEEEKIYYQERSFTDAKEAKLFSQKQLLSMERYYVEKLTAIRKLKTHLGILV